MVAGAQASISGLVPLKISGRHYGENLARLDLLFSSLVHFAPRVVDELLVVARADEASVIGRYLADWPELPDRLVVEDDHFPAFRRFSRPWQVRPWQRQQVIKLNAPAMTEADFVLGALDPDVLALKPISTELLHQAAAPCSSRSHGTCIRDGGGIPPICSTSSRASGAAG